jgi:haloacetate dehalogenase
VEADKSGDQIACPVPRLWAGRGGQPGFYSDVLEVWRPWPPDVRGMAVDASHFLANT